MREAKISRSALLILTSFSILLVAVPNPVRGPGPTLLGIWSNDYFSPDIVDPGLVNGSIAAVDVRVTDLPSGGINAFDIRVNYDPRILRATGVSFASPGCPSSEGCLFDSSRAISIAQEVDSPPGTSRLAVVLLAAVAEGSGTLFRISFRVAGTGYSPIDIQESVSYLVLASTLIPYVSTDGSFDNRPFLSINTITNPSFENGTDLRTGLPVGWGNWTMHGPPDSTITVDSTRAITGNHSAKLDIGQTPIGFIAVFQTLPNTTFAQLSDRPDDLDFWFYLEPKFGGLGDFRVRVIYAENVAELNYVFDPAPVLVYPNITDTSGNPLAKSILLYGYPAGTWHHVQRNLKADWQAPMTLPGGSTAPGFDLNTPFNRIQFDILGFQDSGTYYAETAWVDQVSIYKDQRPPIPVADTVPPSWPPGSVLTASSVHPTGLTLAWTPATDNVGVVNYRIFCCYPATPLATVSGTQLTYNVTGLTPGVTYYFKVEAGDAATNWSTDGPAVTVATPVLSGRVAVVGVWSNAYGSSNFTDPTRTPGSQITVEINVTNAPPFNAYDFFLFYDPNYLTTVSVDEMNRTVFTTPFVVAKDIVTPGTVRLAVVSLGSSYFGANGTLAHMVFRVRGLGVSPLTLAAGMTKPSPFAQSWTRLTMGSMPIDVATSDGYFKNAAAMIGPRADFTFSSPVEGQPVIFDASASFDPDNSTGLSRGIVEYKWDFGDGLTATTSSPTMAHIFSTTTGISLSGNFSVRLTVVDGSGLQGMRARKVDVAQKAFHDITIQAITASPTRVLAGTRVDVTVVVYNAGTFFETFNLTVRFSPPPILLGIVHNQAISLGTSQSFTFVLDTTGLAPGIYQIEAVVSIPADDAPLNNVASTFISVTSLVSGKILLLDLGKPEAEGALRLLNMSFVKVSPTDFSTVDLNLFQVLFVGWDDLADPTAFSALSSRKADIANWVASGHGLVALSEFSVGQFAWLPIPVTIATEHSNPVVITDPSHPVMSGLTDALLSDWGNSYHNYFTGWDPAYGVLAITPSHNLPLTLAASYGSGRIVITGQDPDYHLYFGGQPGAAMLLRNMLNWAGAPSGPPPAHDLSVSLRAPGTLEPGTSTILEASVRNIGTSNETSVQLRILIDGIAVNSTLITSLPSGSTATLTYLWTPTAIGTYNVTAVAPPVSGENTTANNRVSAIVRVQPVISILFDQTHGTDPISAYSIWVDSLRARGYVVSILTGPVSITTVSSYDVFIIPQAHTPYTSVELLVIQDFVKAGGGLLVIGDDNPFIFQQLTSFAGMNWAAGGVPGLTAEITPHEVTSGVISISMYAPIAQIIESAPAESLVRDISGQTMLAVAELNGRVISFVDEDSISNFGVVAADNLRLAGNMVDWLARVPLPPPPPRFSFTLTPTRGTVGSTVLLSGIHGTVDGTVEVKWDGTLVLGRTTVAPSGNFTLTFTVPFSTGGPHTVLAMDLGTNRTATRSFTITPKITVSPDQGPVGTKIVISGVGFTPFESLFAQFDDMFIGFPIFSDMNGTFTATLSIPFSAPGDHTVGVFRQSSSPFPIAEPRVTTRFTVLDLTALDVKMVGGSIYFPGQTAKIFVQLLLKGSAVDATSITASLVRPDGSTLNLNTTRIGRGVYTVTYTIPNKSSLGTYGVIIGAQYRTEFSDSQGSAISSFEVQLTWLQVQGPRIATTAAVISFAAVAIVAWRKGYLRRRNEESSIL